jgi:hypothetical protein
MNGSYEELAWLMEDADHAYRVARVKVFDNVSISALANPDLLTEIQRDALERLTAAENAVASFRASCYGNRAAAPTLAATEISLLPHARAQLQLMR